MKPKKIAQLLATSFHHRRKILLVGSPGIGKSDLVEDGVAMLDAHLRAHADPKTDPASIGADLVTEHPSVADPTNYSGMPAIVLGPKGENHAEFLPFGNLRKLVEAKRLTICFLDDLGQASPAVQAALMQLILARRVNGHKISDWVVFVAATNDTTHMAGVSGLLEPVKSRWDAIIKVDFSSDDFSEWLVRNDFAPVCVAFARSFPHEINAWDKPGFKPTRELKNVACPRTVTSMFRWYQDGVMDYDVWAGAAGDGVTTVFKGYLSMYAKLPSIDAILLDPAKAPLPDSPGANFAVSAGLARKATPGNMDRVCKYIGRLDKEYEVFCVRDALQVTADAKGFSPLTHTSAFIAWAERNKGVLNGE